MRGTVVFPADDRDLLQLLEVRGNNGGVETVETGYILTGSTYYVPEKLHNCDDPDIYQYARPERMCSSTTQIRLRVRDFYEGQPDPRMICPVHTHPSGRTTPSKGDTQSDLKQAFDVEFDDYEFFYGIHGLHDDDRTPDPSWMRVPEQTDHHKVSWYGEYRRHTLAFYDEEHDLAPVMVRSATEPQQQRRQPETRPEPGGEIWD